MSRYYVSLTATCDPEHLHAVLDRMSALLPTFGDAEQLDGLSLSFTRDDGEELLSAGGTLPTSLPVEPDPTVPGTAWPAPAPADPNVPLRSPLPPPGPVTSTGPGASPADAQGGVLP